MPRKREKPKEPSEAVQGAAASGASKMRPWLLVGWSVQLNQLCFEERRRLGGNTRTLPTDVFGEWNGIAAGDGDGEQAVREAAPDWFENVLRRERYGRSRRKLFRFAWVGLPVGLEERKLYALARAAAWSAFGAMNCPYLVTTRNRVELKGGHLIPAAYVWWVPRHGRALTLSRLWSSSRSSSQWLRWARRRLAEAALALGVPIAPNNRIRIAADYVELGMTAALSPREKSLRGVIPWRKLFEPSATEGFAERMRKAGFPQDMIRAPRPEDPGQPKIHGYQSCAERAWTEESESDAI